MKIACFSIQSPPLVLLAKSFNLDFVDHFPDLQRYSFYLKEIDQQLHLFPTDSRVGGSIACDFNCEEYKRLRSTTGIQSPLAKAVGCKSGYRPSVLDITAGLGRDAFILAAMGCQLTLLEKNSVVYLLLSSGLTRASITQSEVAVIISNHINLLPSQDAAQFLADDVIADYDSVYMDPMFPERKKSSKVKKNMQYFHQVVGKDDNDPDSIFELSMIAARRRVVIKRPKGADLFVSQAPSYQINTKSIRFDVYLK